MLQHQQGFLLAFLPRLRSRTVRQLILWLADKLSNMRSFYREHLRLGDAMYQQLNQKDPAMHAWYYRMIAVMLSELSDYPAYREYTELIAKVFD